MRKEKKKSKRKRKEDRKLGRSKMVVAPNFGLFIMNIL
jgi:hypothetical protein